MMASAGNSSKTAAKQNEMIVYLGKELEHEKEANEAHQQRVRFLATQLAHVERHATGEIDVRESHIDALKQRVQQLKEKRSSDEVLAEMQRVVDGLKREYFQALGVGMKLNLAMGGQNVNLDLTSLYDEVSESLPYTNWNRYLSLKLSQELNPDHRASITTELSAMLKNESKFA
jgi:hypothetical protein